MEIQHILFLLFNMLILTTSSLTGDTVIFQERYVCGGHSGIFIASGTNLVVTTSSEELDDGLDVLLRKTRWVKKHTKSLIKEFYTDQRIYDNQPDIVDVPSCLHSFTADTMDLRSHLEILSEVVGVLRRIRMEEDEHEYGYFSHKLNTIQSSVEQLMCQIYIVMGMTGNSLPDRNIAATTSRWCNAASSSSRHDRDFYLLNRIEQLVDNLHHRYHQIKNKEVI